MPTLLTQNPEWTREPKELSASELAEMITDNQDKKEEKNRGVVLAWTIWHTAEMLLAVLESHKEFTGKTVILVDDKDVPGSLVLKSLEEQLQEITPIKLTIRPIADIPEIIIDKKAQAPGFKTRYVPKTQKKKITPKKNTHRKK